MVDLNHGHYDRSVVHRFGSDFRRRVIAARSLVAARWITHPALGARRKRHAVGGREPKRAHRWLERISQAPVRAASASTISPLPAWEMGYSGIFCLVDCLA